MPPASPSSSRGPAANPSGVGSASQSIVGTASVAALPPAPINSAASPTGFSFLAIFSASGTVSSSDITSISRFFFHGFSASQSSAGQIFASDVMRLRRLVFLPPLTTTIALFSLSLSFLRFFSLPPPISTSFFLFSAISLSPSLLLLSVTLLYLSSLDLNLPLFLSVAL